MSTRISTLFAAGFASLVLAACQSVPASDSAGYSDEDEAVYLQRYEAFFGGGSLGLSAYDPLAPVQGAGPVTALPAAASQAIAQSAIDEAVEYAAGTNSSALIIWHKGAVVSETYFGDFDRDTEIISRSLAKPVATIAIGRALAEGHIASLDQPVADFIPEWANDDRSQILIRHLLDMRTGLVPQGFATEAEDILNRAYMHPRHDEVIINDYPLVDVPGERYEYANANSELVAPLIERATGQKYEDWVSTQILKPLGARGGQVWLNREGGTAHSGCCILLPPETFLRLAVLLLQDGSWGGEPLLPDGFVEQMRTPTAQHPHAGMGVYVAGDYIERRGAMNLDKPFGHNLHSEPYLADDVFLFDGNGHQVGYVIPSADLVIMRTGVRPDEGLEWDNAKLPNIILSGMTFDAGAPPKPQPYKYSDTKTELTADDGRAIPLRLLEPAGCDETCPLVIFSHGAFSTYDRYDAVLLPLVELGYRVAAPNHVDSEEHPNREDYGQADSMGKRVEDYAVIASHFEADTVFAVGHSYGGLIAQIAGGAKLSGPAGALNMDETMRPDAVVAISPPGPFPGGMDAEGWSHNEVPMLVVTGTTDILPGFVDDWRDHLASYEASLHEETFALIYTGMDHYLNGSYGRETPATGDELSARDSAIRHMLYAMDKFMDSTASATVLSETDWQTLASPIVEATKREGQDDDETNL